MVNSLLPYKISFFLFLSYSLLNTANASDCGKSTIRNYVSKIEYRPSSTFCGPDMGFLFIQLNNKDKLLGGIRLDIKNSNNRSVTRYPLNLSNADRAGKMTACLNKDYLEHSLITFYFPHEEKKYTTNSKSVTLSNKKEECKLQSLVSNT